MVKKKVNAGVLKTEAALRFLGVRDRRALNALPRGVAEHVYGRPPYVYKLEHLQLVQEIKQATGLSLHACARVAAAKINGTLFP